MHDDELVCLEIGEKCTGALCPLGAAAPNAMVARLLHAGLSVGSLNTSRSTCPSCGFEAEFVLFGKDRASCTICGSSGRWAGKRAEAM